MCSPEPSPVNWITVLQGLSGPVSWFLVIVGWLFFSRDHNRRARRTEIRKIIDETKAQVEKLEAVARGYWLKNGNDPLSTVAALNIKRTLKQLANTKNILQRHDARFDLEMSMKLFRQAITLGDFESRSRTGIPEEHQRFEDIANASIDFIGTIESRFEEIYC